MILYELADIYYEKHTKAVINFMENGRTSWQYSSLWSCRAVATASADTESKKTTGFS